MESERRRKEREDRLLSVGDEDMELGGAGVILLYMYSRSVILLLFFVALCKLLDIDIYKLPSLTDLTKAGKITDLRVRQDTLISGIRVKITLIPFLTPCTFPGPSSRR